MVRPEDDMRPRNFRRPPCEITSIHFEKENTLDFGDQLVYTLEIANCQTRDRRLRLRSVVESGDGRGICMGLSDIFDLETGKKTARTFSMDISSLVPGQYILSLHLMGDSRNSSTGFGDVDKLPRFYIFTIRQSDKLLNLQRSAGYKIKILIAEKIQKKYQKVNIKIEIKESNSQN